MSHVFISFCEEDLEFAQEVSYRIKDKLKIDTWLYTEQLPIGSDWKRDIDEAIRTCSAVVLVLSPASTESKFVTYEWAFALGARKSVLPLMAVTTSELHPKIDDIQWMDFTRQPRWNDFIQELEREINKQRTSIKIPTNAPPVFYNLVESINSSNPNDRSVAIDQLAEADPLEVAISILLQLLEFPMPDVRSQAARALGRIGTKSCVPQLIKLLADRNAEVREAASTSLGQLADEQALWPLLDIVGSSKEASNAVIFSSISALAQIGDTRAVPTILNYLCSGGFQNTTSSGYDIEYLVAKFGTPAIPYLIAKFNIETNADNRLRLLIFIERISPDDAISLLEKAPFDPDDKWRSKVVDYLSKVNDDETNRILGMFSNDPNTEITDEVENIQQNRMFSERRKKRRYGNTNG